MNHFGGMKLDDLGQEFQDLKLHEAVGDVAKGVQNLGDDAADFFDGDSDEEDDDLMYFGNDVEMSSSPLLRALRGDPHPKSHHHGVHERQLVGAWRTLQTPTWIPSRQEVAVVHKIHKDLGLITIQFALDQRRMMVPQAFVEPVQNEPPPVQVRYLPKGAPLPSQEEAEQPWSPYWSHQPPDENGHFPGNDPNGPFPAAHAPQFQQPERWPITQNTAQALRNRSIPPQAVTYTYGEHFYSNLYRHNFYRQHRKDDGRHFYVPLTGGAFEQMHNGNLVPVERLADGSIVRKNDLTDQHDSLFGHFGRHAGVH